MHLIDLDGARAVHDFLAAHPHLPPVSQIDHVERSGAAGIASPYFAEHKLLLEGHRLADVLAWHDALPTLRIALADHAGPVHVRLLCLLPTDPFVCVTALLDPADGDLLRLSTGLRAGGHLDDLDGLVLRRLVEAYAAEEVA